MLLYHRMGLTLVYAILVSLFCIIQPLSATTNCAVAIGGQGMEVQSGNVLIDNYLKLRFESEYPLTLSLNVPNEVQVFWQLGKQHARAVLFKNGNLREQVSRLSLEDGVVTFSPN